MPLPHKAEILKYNGNSQTRRDLPEMTSCRWKLLLVEIEIALKVSCSVKYSRKEQDEGRFRILQCNSDAISSDEFSCKRGDCELKPCLELIQCQLPENIGPVITKESWVMNSFTTYKSSDTDNRTCLGGGSIGATFGVVHSFNP